MHRFVEAHNRRGELAEALGFRLGGGRAKMLFQLRDGSLTLRQLADANGVDAPYATLVVDKLEAHGLVERRPHPDDKRRKLVTLTAAGRAAIATADAILLRPPRAIGTRPAQRAADPAPRGRRDLAVEGRIGGSPLVAQRCRELSPAVGTEVCRMQDAPPARHTGPPTQRARRVADAARSLLPEKHGVCHARPRVGPLFALQP